MGDVVEGRKSTMESVEVEEHCVGRAAGKELAWRAVPGGSVTR